MHCQIKKLHLLVLQIEAYGKHYFLRLPQKNHRNAKSFGKKLKNITKESPIQINLVISINMAKNFRFNISMKMMFQIL